MHREIPLEVALARAVDDIISAQDGPVVLGDHVSVVETLSEEGVGMVVLAAEMTPRHLSLMVKAVDQIVTQFISPGGVADDDGEDSDEA